MSALGDWAAGLSTVHYATDSGAPGRYGLTWTPALGLGSRRPLDLLTPTEGPSSVGMPLRRSSGLANGRRGNVVGRDDIDLCRDGLDGSVNGPAGLHDDVTGAAHVVPQIVVENCGDPPVLDQRQIVTVKIVGDEHAAPPVHELEGVQDRLVSAADGVDRGDLGVFAKKGDGLVADG